MHSLTWWHLCCLGVGMSINARFNPLKMSRRSLTGNSAVMGSRARLHSFFSNCYYTYSDTSVCLQVSVMSSRDGGKINTFRERWARQRHGGFFVFAGTCSEERSAGAGRLENIFQSYHVIDVPYGVLCYSVSGLTSHHNSIPFESAGLEKSSPVCISRAYPN